MILFEKPGRDNSGEALRIAVRRARELNSCLVVATGSGETARLALEKAKEEGFTGPIVAVGSVFDYKTIPQGGNKMSEQTRKELIEAGVTLVFASHVLSGVERGLSTRMSGIYPAELMAHTLRMFGQGTKVCVECSIMALDAGALPWQKPVVAVGGTGKGADTACVLTPAHANDVLATRVHEILCKPSLL